jgi:alpha-mannosidase
MDLGWLWTFDQYNQLTESIISGVIYQLMANTDRKFAFAEMKFFQQWWKDQPSESPYRSSFKSLIAEGRLELLTGGWGGADEACPTYEELIANLMIGHDFIKKEFGVTPRVGW